MPAKSVSSTTVFGGPALSKRRRQSVARERAVAMDQSTLPGGVGTKRRIFQRPAIVRNNPAFSIG
jgi:hypothetical protein